MVVCIVVVYKKYIHTLAKISFGLTGFDRTILLESYYMPRFCPKWTKKKSGKRLTFKVGAPV